MSRARDLTNLISEFKANKTFDFGDWEVKEVSGELQFAYQGTSKFKIDSTGEVTVTDDITAFGTV